jgi:riboflavin kinase / FMN adenylyltransferase
MQVHYYTDQLYLHNTAVTIGSFDGVHLGHKALLSRLFRMADEINGESVLITFNPHPRKVLYPETDGKSLFLINSLEEKIELLGYTRLDHLVIVHFTPEFAKISGEEFVKKILVNKLGAARIVVGFNHHFGWQRVGDAHFLFALEKEQGFKTEEIPEQEIQNETISSTKVRKAIIEGNIQRANAYLDHYYFIYGAFEAGGSISSEAGFPTISLKYIPSEKLIPPSGVYAIHTMIDNIRYKGMLNIKKFEDVDSNVAPIISFHLFNCDREDIYGKRFPVYFHKKTRDEIRFNSPDALKNRLSKDFRDINDLIY